MSKAKAKPQVQETQVFTKTKKIVDSATSRQNLAMKMFEAKIKRIKALSKQETVEV